MTPSVAAANSHHQNGSSGKFVRWDDPKAEYGAGPEEDKVINEIAKQINQAQTGVMDNHHHAFSGTHVKVCCLALKTLIDANG